MHFFWEWESFSQKPVLSLYTIDQNQVMWLSITQTPPKEWDSLQIYGSHILACIRITWRTHFKTWSAWHYPQSFYLVGLRCGPGICIYNMLLGDTDAADLRTKLWEPHGYMRKNEPLIKTGVLLKRKRKNQCWDAKPECLLKLKTKVLFYFSWFLKEQQDMVQSYR